MIINRSMEKEINWNNSCSKKQTSSDFQSWKLKGLLLKPTSPPSIRVKGHWRDLTALSVWWGSLTAADWRSLFCVELLVKRRVCFISHIISLIMPLCMEVNNIVPSAAVVQAQQSIEFTHTFLSDAKPCMMLFSCFVCYHQWENIAGVWVHACLSLCFMAGRWFNGASVWMDGTLRENKSKSTLARAQGLLQHIVMLNTGFSFRTTLSEPWCVLKTAYCGIDLTQYVNYQIYSITL